MSIYLAIRTHHHGSPIKGKREEWAYKVQEFLVRKHSRNVLVLSRSHKTSAFDQLLQLGKMQSPHAHKATST
jgi:hypothetical protein